MALLYRKVFPLLMGGIFLVACQTGAAQPVSPTSTANLTQAPIIAATTATPAQDTPSAVPSSTFQLTQPAASAAATSTEATTPTRKPTARPTLGPDAWKELPVIPAISEHVLSIYQQGQALGNNPQAFSKVGDCGSTPTWFLGDFDRGPEYYNLGAFSSLTGVIDYYQGSFDRTSLAARAGFNASSLFSTLWADRSQCAADEAPLACEYRVHRPSLAFIMLGTNDHWRPDQFEPQMRKIIEYSLENGVIPILSTKADNAEKDWSINATIARLAMEYDIPLWNFWAATSPLPNGGLQEDLAHLTWSANDFSNPQNMQTAWPRRNLEALQILDAIFKRLQASN